MFFIIAIPAFIAAVVLLIVYLVQMNRTREEYLGKDAVKKIAEQAAEGSLKTETALTCDYCGYVIDTTQYDVCPQCGASYGNDSEWLNRTSVDESQMQNRMSTRLGYNKWRVRELNAKKMKRVRILLITLGIVTAIFVASIVTGIVMTVNDKNHSSKAGADYELAGYSFTEPLIAEADGVRLEFGDIYVKREEMLGEQRYSYQVEVRIIRKDRRKGYIAIYVPAANGKCTPEMLYENIGSREEIVRMIDIPYYYISDEALKTLTLYDIRFTEENYKEIVLLDEPREYVTNADFEVAEPEPFGDVIYEKEGLTLSVYQDDYKEILQITNTGDEDFYITTYGDNSDTSVWVNMFIPARCQGEESIRYLEDDEKNTAQLECECVSSPELSFTTGVIEVN